MAKKTRTSSEDVPPTDTAECGSPNCLVVGLDCRSMNPYRFLRVRFPLIPHGTLQDWLQAGKVSLNGAPICDSSPLRAGDVVEIDANVIGRGASRSQRLAIVHEDEFACVVNKESGLACSPDGRGSKRNLCDMLRTQDDENDDCHYRAVHHIDKSASGLVVLAKGRATKQELTDDFAGGKVDWDFLALVSGQFESAGTTVDLPIEANVGRKTRWFVTDHGGRPARTFLRKLVSFRGFTLVHARILVGRSHQVRLHLKHLGHTILGDDWYGGERKLLLSQLKPNYRPRRGETEKPLLERLAMHSAQLRLPWPGTREIRTHRAALPRDLKSALKQLQKHSTLDPDDVLRQVLRGDLPEPEGSPSTETAS